MNDDTMSRLRRDRKAAAIALDKVKLPRHVLTGQAIRPTIVPLGRLFEIVEAEERLAEIDHAIDELQAR